MNPILKTILRGIILLPCILIIATLSPVLFTSLGFVCLVMIFVSAVEWAVNGHLEFPGEETLKIALKGVIMLPIGLLEVYFLNLYGFFG